ncbi:unnamed protein product [Pseudo-nitzschia multistriata]|uniref:Tocopherol cyclase n=1 Tax=Pseudo-nitzschia multistriata TaxID=183589 RepID=A0A448ZF84_9STRA|nr:unnamed protein product [Pseudo-nitzschia multistriata]
MPQNPFRLHNDNGDEAYECRRRQFYHLFGVFLILGFLSSEASAFCSSSPIVGIPRGNHENFHQRSTVIKNRKFSTGTSTTIPTRTNNRVKLRSTESEGEEQRSLLEQIRYRRKTRSEIRRDRRRKKRKLSETNPSLSTTVPHSGRHFVPSHPSYRRPLVQRLFSKLRFRKRFMEGWYYRLTLKEYDIDDCNIKGKSETNAVSFAIIISIEDPGIKSSNLRLACLQAIGPNDQYLVQSTKDDTKFWASKKSQSLGCTFNEHDNNNNTAHPKSRLDPDVWKETVKSGFQITDDSSFRTASTPKHLYKPRWMGRIHGHDGSHGGVLEGQGVGGTLEFDFELDPDSVCGYGGYTTTIGDANATFGHTANTTKSNQGIPDFSTTNGSAGKRRRQSRDANRQKSTGGWLSSFPVFEPHWQVTIADALATGKINWNGTEYRFKDQSFYAEKNWGDALPSKWYWTQCNSFDNIEEELSVTAGGGVRKLPFGKEEELGMIAIHHKGQFYEAVPWKGNVEWNVSTWGEWSLYGDRLEETIDHDTGRITPAFAVEIQYRCDPDKLPGLVFRAPTPKQGMVPFCRDTFEADTVLTLWELKRNENTNEFEKIEPPIIDRARSKEGGAEIGGGPWWETWSGKSQLKPLIKTLLNIPNRFLRY